MNTAYNTPWSPNGFIFGNMGNSGREDDGFEYKVIGQPSGLSTLGSDGRFLHENEIHTL
jgi:hypothetical protein